MYLYCKGSVKMRKSYYEEKLVYQIFNSGRGYILSHIIPLIIGAGGAFVVASLVFYPTLKGTIYQLIQTVDAQSLKIHEIEEEQEQDDVERALVLQKLDSIIEIETDTRDRVERLESIFFTN